MSDDAAATERPLREAIAEEIKVLMVRRNVSRMQLADALGISHTTIWRRLTGETPLDVNELEVVARTLGVEVLDLFPAEVAERAPVAPLASRVLTRRERRLTGSYPTHTAGTPLAPPNGHHHDRPPGRHPAPARPSVPRRGDGDNLRPARLSRPADRRRP